MIERDDDSQEVNRRSALGVTAPRGFWAGSAAAGIRDGKADRPDVGILYSEVPAAAAGVFTANRVRAACVELTERLVRQNRRLQAVVANSGNANACTGERGAADAAEMQRAAADLFGLEPQDVGVASTGVIGVPLPMDRVRVGIEAAAKRIRDDGGRAFAEAIMTTDTRPKEAVAEFRVDGRPATVGGAAKGSGMIHPNMATMLAFLTTDAAVDPAALDAALRLAVDRSFHCISVDGDTSTNDMVLCLANGLAENRILTPEHPDWPAFVETLTTVATELAKAVARDGEGATRLVEVRVEGARSEEDARRAAKAVAGSSLVKTAVYGADPNWGRILCAVGYSGAEFEPEGADVYIGDICVCRGGRAIDFDEEAARGVLRGDPVVLRVILGNGPGSAVAWGCDLTEKYIEINAHYRT
ncbi:MAG: bifunctional glutamate N-acetyltransferase/amino-acid acetyltransferase ArgJ [Alicyclobacillaceae bacterium]|nr:bifunctional glutamate N-acetyltransferase/amino-acid acetyltransferase ArgJ [Alicyclobacillaceae bacterium]